MSIKSFWKNLRLIETAMVLTVIAALLGLAFGLGGLRVNLTSSLPKGLYRLVEDRPARGDLVTFCLDAENPFASLAKERGYLPTGSCPSGLQPLLKKLAGLPGDSVEVAPGGLVLNGRPLSGTARPDRDSYGRVVPPSLLSGGGIPAGSALVLSQEHSGSFDGRHFGLVPFKSLTKVEPVWVSATHEGANAPEKDE